MATNQSIKGKPMLFKINAQSDVLESVASNWIPAELDLERYLIAQSEAEVAILPAEVFGDSLLVISNQVVTTAGKRADILALDQHGNGVVVELKRDKGRLGVETQALQYLADFSRYKGRDFLRRFPSVSEDTILSFVGNEARIEDINKRSRVILVAREFDESLFSMGEWLSTKGVAFRCVTYSPVQLAGDQFLSFSIAFDRSPEALYPLTFAPKVREPGIYWHNIARTDDKWWAYLVANQQIPACFQNAPGDQGEKILTRYVRGDIVVAYAKRYGAVGWGKVEDPNSYRLIETGSEGDVTGDGACRHRLNVSWKATAKSLADGLRADVVKREFGIHHPISTSVSMDSTDGKRLLQALTSLFS